MRINPAEINTTEQMADYCARLQNHEVTQVEFSRHWRERAQTPRFQDLLLGHLTDTRPDHKADLTARAGMERFLGTVIAGERENEGRVGKGLYWIAMIGIRGRDLDTLHTKVFGDDVDWMFHKVSAEASMTSPLHRAEKKFRDQIALARDNLDYVSPMLRGPRKIPPSGIPSELTKPNRSDSHEAPTIPDRRPQNIENRFRPKEK